MLAIYKRLYTIGFTHLMISDKEPVLKSLPPEGVPASIEHYLNAAEQESVGILCKGLHPRDMEKVMSDPRTTHLALLDGDTPILWPLATPISNSSDFSAHYFDTHTPEGSESTHYLSLPPERLVHSPAEQAMVGAALYELIEEGSLLVYDELDGQHKDQSIQKYLSFVSDASIDIDDFIDARNETPAATVAFSTPIRLRRGADVKEHVDTLLSNPLSDTHFLRPEELNDALMDKLWKICEPQFTELTKGSPTIGLASREDFDATLKNPGMRTIVHFEDGEPVATGTIAVHIEACSRLNGAYYKEKFPDEYLMYFVSIASDPNRRGALHSMDIAKLFAQLTVLGDEDFRLLYTCTNVSADYIRRIAERIIRNYEKLGEAEVEELGTYNYRGVRLSSSATSTGFPLGTSI